MAISYDEKLHADVDVRLDDYLNDRIQTATDFDTLDALLANVVEQQSLLKKQVGRCCTIASTSSLTSARNQLDQAEADARDAQVQYHACLSNIQLQAQNFQDMQADIDRRLLIVTRSETSDDAVQRFESSMAKLRALDVASRYTEMLHEVDKLRCVACTCAFLIPHRID